MSFKRITIIGVGLIGGSLARAVREAAGCEEVIGCGRNPSHLETAIKLGVIDRYETDVAKAVDGADMIVVAVPLGAMKGVFRQMVGQLKPGAVITDVGSAKKSVVEAARAGLGKRFTSFVPGHPIAGKEKSGVEVSAAELFRGRCVILTPLPETDAEALKRTRELWEYAGAQVVEMDVNHHDEVLAATSHLPHILAYSLVDTLARMDESEDIFRYAAGGFNDFTRIASSDPVMWRDICLSNREEIIKVLDKYNQGLFHFIEALQREDGEEIINIFKGAKETRDRHCH